MSKAGRAFLPLMLLWLAVHAVILAAFLSIRFLTVKLGALLLLALLGAWLLLRPRPAVLSSPPSMV